MYVIYPRRDTAVSSNSEDAAHPDDNVRTYHPGQTYKAAATNTATLKMTVAANSSGLAVFNTNAEDIDVTIKNVAEDTILVAKQEFALDTLTRYYTDASALWRKLWVSYAVQAVEHKAIIDFTAAAGTTLEVGEIVCGLEYEFPTPPYGIQHSYIDYSIVHGLNYPGAKYRLDKDVGNVFTFSLLVQRDSTYWYFMRDFVEQNKSWPVPWKLTDQTNRDWLVYGSYSTSFPSGSHIHKDHSIIDVTVIEEF